LAAKVEYAKKKLVSRMTLCISYATPEFVKLSHELFVSLKKYGYNKSRLFRQEELFITNFYQAKKEILNAPRGAGYWLWKPYIILETLRQLPEGDILLYADAACRFIASPKPLIRLAQHEPSGVVAFHLRPLQATTWCKRDAFIRTGCDAPDYWESDKVMGGLLLFRKCDCTMRLVTEWLEWCCRPGTLTDAPSTLGEELPGFTEHRHDQALLGLLLKKHGIEAYRNPSIWGNPLKMPKYRVQGEHLFYPFRLQADYTDYAPVSDMRSPYGTLVELNRKGFYYKQPDNRWMTRMKRRLVGWFMIYYLLLSFSTL
jgi:hypothetical protein